MIAKNTLAVATPSPFFELALDLPMQEKQANGMQPGALMLVGESIGELSLPFGIAMILNGSPPSLAAGIAMVTIGLISRRKQKRKK